jgi:uncharacterized protein YndB with AHSA1/START domain
VSRGAIRWKIALRSPPERVYQALSTEAGRQAFWALEAGERDGVIHFRFPNGWTGESKILRAEPPNLFEIDYFGMPTRFEIEPVDEGAALTVIAEGVPDHDWDDVHAGWVSVLLILKASVDFGIDLRNGDPSRSWDAGFVDQ